MSIHFILVDVTFRIYSHGNEVVSNVGYKFNLI